MKKKYLSFTQLMALGMKIYAHCTSINSAKSFYDNAKDQELEPKIYGVMEKRHLQFYVMIKQPKCA